MKIAAILGLCLGLVSASAAQQVLTEYDWRQLAQSGELLGGVPTTVDGKTVLMLANTNETARQVQILKIKKPAITKTLYAVIGEVKYEGVRGNAYLEMWN